MQEPAPDPARNRQLIFLAGLCTAIVALYAVIAWTRVSELGNRTAETAYYNRLVDGFRAGQLSLKLEAPPGLAALADPYDPEANADFRGSSFVNASRLHDLSYYQGKLYLYFGVAPVLLLFWPYAAVTGHYLEHAQAVTIFISVGFLAGVWLLRSTRQRYFPQTSGCAVAAGAVALGLTSGIPVMLNRPDVWEVPIACGFALTMLTLVALWRTLHEPRRQVWTLAAASAAYGLAVASRPSLLFGAVILLVPVLRAWSNRRDPAHRTGDWRRLLPAAVAPLACIGLGLAYYNYQRFGSPVEFGQTFQLAGERQDIHHFGLGYLWFNLRAYFFAWGSWSGGFPYLQQPDLPPLPAGHGGVDLPFALLTHAPFALFALAVPLAWKSRSASEGPVLRAGLATLAGAFLSSALVMGLFYGTCLRYETEFAPALFLLAAIGAMALDRALADRGGLRAVFRAGALGLLLVSVTGNFLAASAYRGQMDQYRGISLLADGKNAESVPVFESALRFDSHLGQSRIALALALLGTSRSAESSPLIAEAVRLNPGRATSYYQMFGPSLLRAGRKEDLLVLLRATIALHANAAPLHYDLGALLAQTGRMDEARTALNEALRLDPTMTAARDLLQRLGTTSTPLFLRR